MAEQIILATDGGPASESALAWVADRVITLKLPSRSCPWKSSSGFPSGPICRLIRPAISQFSALRSPHCLVPRWDLQGRDHAVHRGPRARLLQVAGAVADLLVVESPRSLDNRGALHGTLALRVAAHATGNVIVVPAAWQPHQWGLVVGVDEDGSSDAAVSWAAREAERMGRELLLVHCWTLPAPFSVLDDLLGTTYPTLERIHQDILDEAVTSARQRHLTSR